MCVREIHVDCTSTPALRLAAQIAHCVPHKNITCVTGRMDSPNTAKSLDPTGEHHSSQTQWKQLGWKRQSTERNMMIAQCWQSSSDGLTMQNNRRWNRLSVVCFRCALWCGANCNHWFGRFENSMEASSSSTRMSLHWCSSKHVKGAIVLSNCQWLLAATSEWMVALV